MPLTDRTGTKCLCSSAIVSGSFRYFRTRIHWISNVRSYLIYYPPKSLTGVIHLVESMNSSYERLLMPASNNITCLTPLMNVPRNRVVKSVEGRHLQRQQFHMKITFVGSDGAKFMPMIVHLHGQVSTSLSNFLISSYCCALKGK